MLLLHRKFMRRFCAAEFPRGPRPTSLRASSFTPLHPVWGRGQLRLWQLLQLVRLCSYFQTVTDVRIAIDNAVFTGLRRIGKKCAAVFANAL